MKLKDIEKLKFDSRMVDINMKARTLSDDEFQKHLDKLPDLADQSMKIDIDGSSDHEHMNGHQ
jgi:hypothetical protein